MTGSELDQMDDNELAENINRYGVYARVQPEHKVRIVNAWKKHGCVTAMTGDGVNDAPSIKAADIGVGMGITGTDVTKNVADMVSMKTGKLTAQALQAALKKYLQHRAKGPKLHHGKQSLKQLKAHGAALTNIEVTEANIGAFKPCAKKYGVDFTLRKDKTTQPPHYIVIFKAKDTDNLEQAFREFTAKTLSKEQRPSIRKVLTAAKQKAAQQPKRAKEKIKQRELER